MIPDPTHWPPAVRQAVRSSLSRWFSLLRQRPQPKAELVLDCGRRYGYYKLTVAEAEELERRLTDPPPEGAS